MASLPSDRVEFYARELLRLREEWEFDTFWLGAHVPGPISPEEAIALKQLVNRSISERAWELKIAADSTPVNTVAHIDIHWPDGPVEIRVAPLLVFGRYLKFSREIPQSRWPCRVCGGAGCEACGGTGKKFDVTVEELIGAPLLKLAGAERTKMHAVGREDVDAKMLGRGRPFIISLASPHVRTIDLGPVQEQLNTEHAALISIRDMRLVGRDVLEKLIKVQPEKSYRAEVKCHVPARRSLAEKLGEIRELELAQETPRRVLHRRANKIRRRIVRECSVEIPEQGDMVSRFFLTLRVQSGTYIKEFINCDEGRTNPSITHMLRVPCDCVALDVMDVHWDPE